MKSWIQNEQEENYLRTLDELLLQRLRNDDEPSLDSERSSLKALSQFSIEINEELDRLESILAVELEYP